MKKILVVDDNQDTVITMQLVLERAGYEVTVAYNGQQGLDQALNVLPDIILLDMMMPIMDGYTMNQHLKKNEKTRNIPVIVISARSGMAPLFDPKNGTQVTDYLVKPITAKSLLSKIDEVIKTRPS